MPKKTIGRRNCVSIYLGGFRGVFRIREEVYKHGSRRLQLKGTDIYYSTTTFKINYKAPATLNVGTLERIPGNR